MSSRYFDIKGNRDLACSTSIALGREHRRPKMRLHLHSFPVPGKHWHSETLRDSLWLVLQGALEFCREFHPPHPHAGFPFPVLLFSPEQFNLTELCSPHVSPSHWSFWWLPTASKSDQNYLSCVCNISQFVPLHYFYLTIFLQECSSLSRQGYLALPKDSMYKSCLPWYYFWGTTHSFRTLSPLLSVWSEISEPHSPSWKEGYDEE